MKRGNNKFIAHFAGIVLFILMILILTAAVSHYMIDKYISSFVQEMILILIVFCASMSGNIITLSIIKDKHIIVSSINTIIMASFLIIMGACLEGKYQNITLRIVPVAIGVITSSVILHLCVSKTRYRKKRYR